MYIAETSPVLNVEDNASGTQCTGLKRGITASLITFVRNEFENEWITDSDAPTHGNGRGCNTRRRDYRKVIDRVTDGASTCRSLQQVGGMVNGR
ncbi:hypothetical protein [Streptomyces chattanoogensis]|uniref:hypothetical protein n=1 Tax=Streptomyces chattanoogensis TaxID=66876 RepID=UPI0012FF1DE6|nr:hypothetical protein [Streptomyces chattanoogensis]